MSPLIETIKCNDGKLVNMEFHQARFEKAQKEYFGVLPQINLIEHIEIPDYAKDGLFRCRITYSTEIDKIEFIPYQYREIKSLKVVEANEIEYRFKYENRHQLNQLFEKRGYCDDIIIVKNGYVTDSFAGNLLFFDGNKWWTPDTPLLLGTKRAQLIVKRKIFKCKITQADLKKFELIGLINAMYEMENMPVIKPANIQY